jgi:putative transposase
VKGFSYTGPHRYFVTICACRRKPWFADADQANWLTAQISPFFEPRHFAVIAYCVMPDHLHLVLEGTSPDADLRETVRLWKLRTAFAWRVRTESQLWQQGFHDRVLREDDDTGGVVRYVLENPVRAGLVGVVSDYPWLGSSRYTLAALQEHAGQWKPEWKSLVRRV